MSHNERQCLLSMIIFLGLLVVAGLETFVIILLLV